MFLKFTNFKMPTYFKIKFAVMNYSKNWKSSLQTYK